MSVEQFPSRPAQEMQPKAEKRTITPEAAGSVAQLNRILGNPDAINAAMDETKEPNADIVALGQRKRAEQMGQSLEGTQAAA